MHEFASFKKQCEEAHHYLIFLKGNQNFHFSLERLKGEGLWKLSFQHLVFECAIHHCLHSTVIFLRKSTLLRGPKMLVRQLLVHSSNSINHPTLLSIHLKILVLWHPKPNCGFVVLLSLIKRPLGRVLFQNQAHPRKSKDYPVYPVYH